MFDRFQHKFFLDQPTDEAGFQIYRGSWKYGYDVMSCDQVRKQVSEDPRPRWCAEVWGSLNNRSVLELGPADGYNTAALENLGAQVTAVEGNVDAFLRCLILKNALGMRARFQLGDFGKAVGGGQHYDAIYASGVLYHLQDPIDFLARAAESSPRLYLWTHYYDEQFVPLVEHERKGFAGGRRSTRSFKGRDFVYYEKSYDLGHVELAGYIGGLNATANWISRDDLFGAVEAVGYRIERVVEDPFNGAQMPAVNIFAQLA